MSDTDAIPEQPRKAADGGSAVPQSGRSSVVAPLRPSMVPLKVALRLLGDKGRSKFYEEAAQGEYDLYKDGNKLLVGIASIERHNANLPRAKIGRRESA